jgi:hypothetical protein
MSGTPDGSLHRAKATDKVSGLEVEI